MIDPVCLESDDLLVHSFRPQPLKARQHYCLPRYPHFIEFYLHSSAWGKSVMSKVLPKVIRQLQAQGVYKIGAVVNKRNRAAGGVLNKAGFIAKEAFDHAQDLYELKAA